MHEKPWWLIVAPVVFLFLWSGGYVVAKVGLVYSPPLTLLVLRFACVVVLMAVLFVFIKPKLPKTMKGWGHLAIVGLLMQTVYFGLSYIAFMNGIAAGTAALIMSLQPILVALIAPSWSGEHISIRQWGGLVLALVGTAIVIIARMEIGPAPTFGLICAALALAGITSATLWEKRFGVSHHPVTTNLIGYAAGLIGILPFMLFSETSNHLKYPMTESLEQILENARACTQCKENLPLGPRPVVRAETDSPILIIGQAPGTKVHASGIPWDDVSGNNLREWLGIDKTVFYDTSKVAIVPIGFCYPGKGKSGDLPPRPECAPKWHEPILRHLTQRKLTLLIGQYAQLHYLGKEYKTLTERVKNWAHAPEGYFPLPHPSPRNRIWMKKNPWFELEVLPELKSQFQQALKNSKTA